MVRKHLQLAQHTTDTTHTHNRLTALCPALPAWVGTRSNIHPPTPVMIINFLKQRQKITKPARVWSADLPLVDLESLLQSVVLYCGSSLFVNITRLTRSIASLTFLCTGHRRLPLNLAQPYSDDK